MQPVAPDHRPDPSDQDAEHDIFTDPALQQTFAEDPLFKFLKVWWRQLLIVSLAIGAGWYVFYRFQETHITALKASADTFYKVRQSFDELRTLDLQRQQELPAADVKPTEELEKKLADLDSQIATKEQELAAAVDSLNDSKEPYRSFAELYRALLRGRAGDIDGMRAIVAPDGWKSVIGESSPERLVRELAAVAEARIMLDSPQHADEGKAILRELVSGGGFVNLSAAQTLGALAQSEAEREELIGLLENLRGRRLSQAGVIDKAIEQLGGAE